MTAIKHRLNPMAAVPGARDSPGVQAYLRPKWDEMVYIGMAEWVVE